MDDKRSPDRAAVKAAVDRLRAADPAAGAAPDAVALRAAVEDRRRGAPHDELAARRLRRLTSWPARAAAVAAAALVVGGGGGYALGAAGGGGGNEGGGEVTADAPIVLEVPGDEGMESTDEAAGAGDSPGFLPEAALTAGGGRLTGADVASWPGWYGRTVFRASALSADGGTGHGWALDASGVSADAAAQAAAALGVRGEPRLEYGTWVVGPNDGSGATVSLSADGPGSLSYWNPANDVAYCDVEPVPGTEPAPDERSAADGEADPGTGGGSVDMPVPPQRCEGVDDAGDAPQGDAAVAVLRELMTALGADPAGYQLVADDAGDGSYSWVTAHHVVDGQQTGLTWSLGLTGKGATSLYGVTAALVDLGEYEVVSPAEAVERLNDPRFGAGWAGPIMMAGARGAETDVAIAPEEPDGEPPVPPGAGSAFAWPVREVTIVDARLGVAVAATRDGATVLAPSYALTADDGSVWSVIAVAERHLDFAAD